MNRPLFDRKGKYMKQMEPIYLSLTDDQWPFTYTDHRRQIARAIAYDDGGDFYFVQAIRDDIFGCATILETAGGGVEPGETPDTAIHRELAEELGAQVEVICKLGVVEDDYNLIHRHNINHYYLCRVLSLGEPHLMPDEIRDFHLSTRKLSFDGAVAEYRLRSSTPLGTLVAARELPILRQAGKILELL